MKQLTCEICGGDVLMKEGDHFRCTNCGACYAPEQLKAKIATPEQVAPEAVSQEPEIMLPKILQPKRKYSAKWEFLSAIFIAALFLAALVGILVSGVAADKSTAKSCLERDIRDRYEDAEVTIHAIHFESVEAVKFRSREEDPVGYFDYMDEPISVLQDDGSLKRYDSQFASIAEGYIGEYDPEASVKFAYRLQGSFEGTHATEGDFTAEFSYIYVEDEHMWRAIKHDCKPTYDMLRKDLRNYLSAYMLTTYEVSNIPEIAISYIDEKANGDYLVYGTISFKGKYGEEGIIKFDAKYQRWDYELTFERKEVNVEYPDYDR